MKLHSKLSLTGLLSLSFVSFAIAFNGYIQADPSTETWLSLVKWLGAGAIGILSIMAITRLIMALKNQPLDGHKVTADLLAVMSRLDLAIALMNTTTRNDHERMLKHDEAFMERLEAVTANDARALANHNAIIQNQANIIKQLDRMENKR